MIKKIIKNHSKSNQQIDNLNYKNQNINTNKCLLPNRRSSLNHYLQHNSLNPLIDIKSSIYNEQIRFDKTQNYLKSESSLNDISEIVAIEGLSAQKKDNPTSHVTFNLPYSTTNKYEESKHKISRKSFKSFKQNYEKSLQLQDFQILDIYSTKNIQKNLDCHIQHIKEKRKFGEIRKVSQVLVNYQPTLSHQQHTQIILKQTKQKKYDYSLFSSNKSSQKSSFDFEEIFNTGIKKCGQILFKAISQGKNYLDQADIEKCGLICQIKLILGPILTKFRQKKYSQLNLYNFQSEFFLVMNDFSPKQRLDITYKIYQNRYLQTNQFLKPEQKRLISQKNQEKKHQLQSSKINSQIKYFNESNYSHKPSLREFNVENQSDLTPQTRFNKLNSKVDQYLSKITKRQKPASQVKKQNRRQKLSSQLSQIQELSSESSDYLTQRDSLSRQPKQKKLIKQLDQISKEVYMRNSIQKEKQYFSNQENKISTQKINQKLEKKQLQKNYQLCMESYQRQKQIEIQQNERLGGDCGFRNYKESLFHQYAIQKGRTQKTLNNKTNLYSSNSTVIQIQPQKFSLNQGGSAFYNPITQQKTIHLNLFSDQKSQIRSSFRAISLQFNQLKKYWY